MKVKPGYRPEMVKPSEIKFTDPFKMKSKMEKSIHILKRLTLPSNIREAIIDSISYFFIFLFIYTAYNKGMDYSSFSKSLARYSLIKPYANQIAWMIPAAELFVSGLLLFPKTRKLGLISALILMLIFTTALLIMVFIMDAQYCSCGGVLNSMSASEHLGFNTGFIILAIIGVILSRNKESMKI